MHVGIVTLFGDNYGNKLQNYALQKMIESHGNTVETLIVKSNKTIHKTKTLSEITSKMTIAYICKVAQARFKNKYPHKNDRDGLIESIQFAKKHNVILMNQQRHLRFDSFVEKYIKISDIELTFDSYKDNKLEAFDCFVCGSDQIWNPTYPSTTGLYFLTFAPKHKRIAYAPSFGLSELPENVKPVYQKWLADIPYLSVREYIGAEHIRNLTGRNAEVVADPTLCIDKKEWEGIEHKPNYIHDERFVLTYFLGNETTVYRKYIEEYAQKSFLKIIDLFDTRAEKYYSTDPAEFVWLIHHAEAVMTDSFHATVFSMIFHTPFVVFDRMENGGMAMSSRIDTLLDGSSLEYRRFGRVSFDKISDISFEKSDNKIAAFKEKSLSYLEQSLERVAKRKIPFDSPIFFLTNKRDCTGCAACFNACSKKCIVMQSDEEGFYYPYINENLCIKCGKCVKVCPSVNIMSSPKDIRAYVGYAKDEKVRRKSSSGGLFSILAESVLQENGAIYGAGFDKCFSVKHISIEKVAGLNKLRGSKYVQSDIGTTYTEVKQRLESGQKVYYSGTPCQIEGLLCFLGKTYENLITQDIICHGVPSPIVWKEYLKIISKGEHIEKVSFRNKRYGWHYFSMLIKTGKRQYVKRLDEDTFIRLFLDNIILRPSCYDCKYKKQYRLSDITIADCWSIEKVTQQLKDDDKGISLIFANTSKGELLLKNVSDMAIIREVDLEVAISSQSAMTKSVPMNPDREIFFENAKVNGFQKIISEWYGYDMKKALKTKYGFLKYRINTI